MIIFDEDQPQEFDNGVLVLTGFDLSTGAATNRLLLENGNGLQLEDGSGDLALE